MKNKLQLMFVLDYFKGLLLSPTRKHLQKSLPYKNGSNSGSRHQNNLQVIDLYCIKSTLNWL
ncbi:hypothetical protein [Peribacillus frigoritolerans]|uniref:hypothetical protein n=1 Tax=Peribacillus castrilensis TaxID=2897690 RepID=UPI002DCDA393|nr:hypothetical protein [Peribacillus castrilensis]